MKKLTSVILSVLMVISLFGCLFTGTTVTAESTAANLIVNGDFESFDVNTEHNNTALPGLGYRSVNSVFPTDKTNGQWYRSGGGLSPSAAPDLKEDYKIYNPTEDKEYPTYFGPNNQMVLEPGVEDNHVLRAVQDLYTQVEPKDNGEYALTFRFKLPNNDTGLSYFDLFFVSPKLNSENGQSIQNNLKYPFSITSATVDSSCTGISCNKGNSIVKDSSNNELYNYDYLRITFDGTNTGWQDVKVTFKTVKNTDGDAQQSTYKENDVTYTSPVLLNVTFAKDGIDLSTELAGNSAITAKKSYHKKCIYFDDFEMYELVNCIGDAEFYDVKGNKLDNEQAYTNITTTVNNTETSTIYSGEEVTATVEYDKDSGAYFFLGWYDETGAKVSTSETFTFTATAGETYTPHFGSANLLGSSGSFEGLTTGMHLRMDAPTDDTPNYPTGNKWGFNVNAGYWGKTWEETVTLKNGTTVNQTSNGSIRTDVLKDGNCNILENTAIAKSGSKVLHIQERAPISLGLDNLDKNTDYVLSFYLRYSDANINKIYAGAITTTVNICDATLSNSMKKSLENAISAVNHPIVVAKLDSTDFSNASADDWKKVTVKFNSGDLNKLYLALRCTAGATPDYYIDDMVLVKAGTANSVSANVEFHDANGDAVVSSNEYAKADIIGNFDGTYTTAVDYDRDSGAYTFKGWYYNDELITDDETFILDSAKYDDLTKLKAVVVSTNILPEAASFEGYKNSTKLTYTEDEATDGDYPEPTSIKWGTSYGGKYFEDNYFKIHTVYGEYSVPCYDAESDSYIYKQFTAHNGNAMLRINTHSRSAIRALENLTPNTDYQLTFYVMGTSSVDYLNVVAVADRYNGYNLSTATESTEGTIAIKELTYTEGWQKVELSFNSGENDTLYLHLYQQNKTSIESQGGSFIDDLSLIAMPKVDGISYKGASIRAYATEDKPQALRHKFEIKKSLINEGIALYGELVEYGSVAIRTDYLGNKELVKDGLYTYNDTTKKAVTGVAYNKDDSTNKIFIENEDSIVFTAALTGIGKTGSGTDYAAFGKEYSVRNYLIFRNGTKETIVYTETQSYSVFDVMDYIITTYKSSASPDDILTNDYNTIQSIFKKIPAQETEYNKWKKSRNS